MNQHEYFVYELGVESKNIEFLKLFTEQKKQSKKVKLVRYYGGEYMWPSRIKPRFSWSRNSCYRPRAAIQLQIKRVDMSQSSFQFLSDAK